MTYLTTACRVANLHAILSDFGAGVAPELLSAYKNFKNYDGRGTRIFDSVTLQPSIQLEGIGDPGRGRKEIKITPSAFAAFKSRLNAEAGETVYVPALQSKQQHQIGLNDRAVLCTKVMVRGVRYQPLSSSSRNCHIIFRDHRNIAQERPGQIQEILLHKRRLTTGTPMTEETFIVVQTYSPLLDVDIPKDDYRKYGVAGALYYAHFENNVVVIRPQDIVCHFAKTTLSSFPIESPCIHVLPLNRVGCVVCQIVLVLMTYFQLLDGLPEEFLADIESSMDDDSH